MLLELIISLNFLNISWNSKWASRGLIKIGKQGNFIRLRWTSFVEISINPKNYPHKTEKQSGQEFLSHPYKNHHLISKITKKRYNKKLMCMTGFNVISARKTLLEDPDSTAHTLSAEETLTFAENVMKEKGITTKCRK